MEEPAGWGQGHRVAGAECHSPVHLLGGVELGSSGQPQALCELRERLKRRVGLA